MMPDIIAFVKDIFFNSKIYEFGKHNSLNVFFVKNESELFDSLSKDTKMILFDLGMSFDLNIIREIKSNRVLSNVKVIGFLQHVEVDLKNKALGSGFDKVYSRFEFSKELASDNLLKSI